MYTVNLLKKTTYRSTQQIIRVKGLGGNAELYIKFLIITEHLALFSNKTIGCHPIYLLGVTLMTFQRFS